jgi:hypothetical protein
MWMLAALVYVHRQVHPRRAEERIALLEEILHSLPHDHTAWYMVHSLLECCLRLEDFDRYLEVYNRYAVYTARERTEEEYCDRELDYMKGCGALVVALLQATSEKELRAADQRFRAWCRDHPPPRWVRSCWKRRLRAGRRHATA